MSKGVSNQEMLDDLDMAVDQFSLAGTMNEGSEKLLHLINRFSKLPERQKGFVDVHMRDALQALETGISMAESSAAKHAETRKRAVVRGFRVISSA